MGTSERLHRPDPERSAPIRDAATYLRDAPPGDLEAAGMPPAPESAESIVAHGVRVGYQVLEAQIAQGQRLAQRLGKATTAKLGGAAAPGELGVLIERVLTLYKDVGALCVDAVDAVARSSALRAGLARAAQAVQTPHAGGDEGGAAAPARGTRFAVEVASSRRTQVTLELAPGRYVPAVHALHARDTSIPPLTGVTFSLDAAHPEPRLRVEVPEAQPPGIYSGVVVDSASNEPRGTVVVRLLS